MLPGFIPEAAGFGLLDAQTARDLAAAAARHPATCWCLTALHPDGTEQVTYFGHPLYFFAFDQPGQTLGEGITAFGGTFDVVNLTGAPV